MPNELVDDNATILDANYRDELNLDIAIRFPIALLTSLMGIAEIRMETDGH